MGFLDRLFGKKESEENNTPLSFDKQFKNHIKSMVEICYEYIGRNQKEVDNIYIHCSTREGIAFNFFFCINGTMTSKERVNKELNKKIDFSVDQVFAVMDIGTQDLLAIMNLFKKDNREVPSELRITYTPKTKKMQTDISYENIFINKNDASQDIMKQWMESLINKE